MSGSHTWADGRRFFVSGWEWWPPPGVADRLYWRFNHPIQTTVKGVRGPDNNQSPLITRLALTAPAPPRPRSSAMGSVSCCRNLHSRLSKRRLKQRRFSLTTQPTTGSVGLKLRTPNAAAHSRPGHVTMCSTAGHSHVTVCSAAGPGHVPWSGDRYSARAVRSGWSRRSALDSVVGR